MTARLQTDAGADLVRILQVPAPTMHATGPAFEQRHFRQHRRRAPVAAAPLSESPSA